MHSVSMRAFRDELEKIARTRWKEEMAAGNITPAEYAQAQVKAYNEAPASASLGAVSGGLDRRIMDPANVEGAARDLAMGGGTPLGDANRAYSVAKGGGVKDYIAARSANPIAGNKGRLEAEMFLQRAPEQAIEAPVAAGATRAGGLMSRLRGMSTAGKVGLGAGALTLAGLGTAYGLHRHQQNQLAQQQTAIPQ